MANEGLAAAAPPGTPQIPFDANIFKNAEAQLAKKGLNSIKLCYREPGYSHLMSMRTTLWKYRDDYSGAPEKKHIAGILDFAHAGRYPCFVTAIPHGMPLSDYFRSMPVKDKITNAIKIFGKIIDIRKFMLNDFTYTSLNENFVRVVLVCLVHREGMPFPMDQPSRTWERESVSIGKLLYLALTGKPYRSPTYAQAFSLEAMLINSRGATLNQNAPISQSDKLRITAMEAFLKAMFVPPEQYLSSDNIKAELAKASNIVNAIK
ncbi:hypothetical protein BDF22DRAFT_745852 [Syncephalis plumigaleata]|nr:hypothetical protein BDF22DRAFT_745852 [Syncephalis plumigaleata]